MRVDEIEDAEELMKRIEEGEPGDVLIFDEAGAGSPARKSQAKMFKKVLDTERKK